MILDVLSSPASVEERVLLLPPTRRDAEAIQKLLGESGIACVLCAAMSELCEEVDRGAGAILVSEEALAAEPHGLARCISEQPVWSDIPNIVLSKSGLESPKLAPILARTGNVTVLERPVRLSTFLSVVRSALRGRTRQYQVRDHLAEMELADAALRRSRDAFFTLIDRAPFGIYILDSRLRIHSVNGEAQGIFQNVRPLIGADFAKAIRVIWPEPFAARALGHFRHTLSTGASYVAPSVTETRQDVGLVQSFEWELHRITLPDGMPGVVCYFYESTKLRRIETELRESRRRSDAALLAGDVGTYYWDIVNDRLGGDSNFAEMFGVTLNEQGAAPLDDFIKVIHVEDRERVTQQLRATLETDAPFDAEYRVLHRGGERWVSSKGVVERNEFDEPIGWTGVVVNITERMRSDEERRLLLESEQAARADAERALRMKDEFLATLSHELRTPLNAILGWTHILGLESTRPDDMSKGLAVIERNARAQTQIIADLLDMNRIISGKVRLDVRPMSLGPIVQAAVDAVAPAAQAKGVALQVSLESSADLVSGDPDRLQQVFWNLLSNAVKFTSRSHRICVKLVQVDSQIEVSVSDTGEGIAPTFLPYVFDRFRQADGSSTRRHGGLGLGLAIVKQIVELHGGSVRATSAGPGQGSTFTVTLPQATSCHNPDPEGETQSVLVSPSGPTVAEGDIAGMRILAVDDELDSRELLRRLLEGWGASVTLAASAKEALALLRQTRPEILIADIGMPGEDGYSLIRKVRELAPDDGGATIAISLTAYVRPEDRAAALRAGFHHHISKPVEPAELIALLVGIRDRMRGTPTSTSREKA